MARGGSRPGAGRPRKDGLPPGSAPAKRPSRAKVKATSAVGAPKKSKGVKPVGGYSVGGVKHVDAPKDWPFGTVAPESESVPAAGAVEPGASLGEAPDPNLTPLDYLLRVVRDPAAAINLRIQAANIAAPYMHVKKGEGGKKSAEEEAAKRASTRRFAAAAAPLKLVNAAKK